ncbi:MAG: ABC transporter ATP-binding protein [Gammaproteobacteria bacterium]|nr:ABC transporter ATP-binding protein [Gammaproteobacteria bacterium]MCY4219086.1 ABC transporter ATP-binding protein [Gammaproteobacteria bacterium]MCY4274548.1 ABC transporter ATP-binding protein [Gammaproteobacteria bacterium]
MAKITLQNIQHSYLSDPKTDFDFALKHIDVVFEDGGAYALLGPSGCGKTTLLGIVSGLISPTSGRVLFDEQNVTHVDTIHRHIAQVFQFPVIYDTMTVFDNLAFPLRNRKVPEPDIKTRVLEVARMLDLEEGIHQRAASLTVDGKQKISLGRGLVREDVNVMMFDEPLTVIDQNMKWELRSKLKELHQNVRTTMIYVTHDQTEALTFADKVFVMYEGKVVQFGTPVELFEKPGHTFVGYFIGSPGMNILPCQISEEKVEFSGLPVKCDNQTKNLLGIQDGVMTTEIGVRPEYIRFANQGIPVKIRRVDDLGRHQLVHTEHEQHDIKLICPEDTPIPDGSAHIEFDAEHTFLYVNQWLASEDNSI